MGLSFVQHWSLYAIEECKRRIQLASNFSDLDEIAYFIWINVHFICLLENNCNILQYKFDFPLKRLWIRQTSCHVFIIYLDVPMNHSTNVLTNTFIFQVGSTQSLGSTDNRNSSLCGGKKSKPQQYSNPDREDNQFFKNKILFNDRTDHFKLLLEAGIVINRLHIETIPHFSVLTLSSKDSWNLKIIYSSILQLNFLDYYPKTMWFQISRIVEREQIWNSEVSNLEKSSQIFRLSPRKKYSKINFT
jgi:hypothetical protein